MTPIEYLEENPELQRIVRELRRAGDIKAITTWDELRARLSPEDAATLLAYLQEFGRVFDPAPKIQ